MYPIYSHMIEPVYKNYFTQDGHFRYKHEFEQKNKVVLKQEVYDYLTSEPPQQGNQYFDGNPQNLAQSVLQISDKRYDTFVTQDYFFINIDNLPANKATYQTVRVVANIVSQTEAINIATQLLFFCNQNLLPTLYKCKILLGNNSNAKPVKLDKIVIYNKIDTSKIQHHISSVIMEQIEKLRNYCQINAALPQFVAQPYKGYPVGFGEGIFYNKQDMTFSEPRADSVLEVLMERKDEETTDLNLFQQLLSEEFKKRGLSQNIPYINQCSKQFENMWN